MCAMRSGTSSAPPATTSRPPKVRWSTNRSSRPPSVKVNRTRRWVSSGLSGGTTSSWPLMPRWPVSASPESSGSQRYFPRRWAAMICRPASRLSKSAAPARCRRTARGCATETRSIVRPTTPRSRPTRTTSTSGSSGTVELAPGCFGRLLLGLLLAAAGALAVDRPLDDGGSSERLLVVRAALVDDVLRDSQAARSGELLQARLPVERGALSRRRLHERIEQAPDHDGRAFQATVEVDRADDRLHRVARIEALSRPFVTSSPLPRRSHRPRSSERATPASARVLT